jgi:hypothetical protein
VLPPSQPAFQTSYNPFHSKHDATHKSQGRTSQNT